MSAAGPGRVSLVHPRRSPVAAPLPMIAQATLDRETGESLPAHAEHDRQTAYASAGLGALMMLAAVVVLVDAASLRESDAAMGPAVVPTAVGILLGAVGILLAGRSWWDLRAATRADAAGTPGADGATAAGTPGADGATAAGTPDADGATAAGATGADGADGAGAADDAGSAGDAPDGALASKAPILRLAGMVVVLIAFALLLPLLGYVVCAALLFTGAALLLGAPRPLTVLAYGWTLAIVVFLVFDRLIGLALPVGPWGF